MKRFSFSIALGLGALALIWVAAAVASSHFLVLVMTLLIGAVYGFGAWELRNTAPRRSHLTRPWGKSRLIWPS